VLVLAGAVLMFAGALWWRVLVFCWCRRCAAATADLLRNPAATLRDAADVADAVVGLMLLRGCLQKRESRVRRSARASEDLGQSGGATDAAAAMLPSARGSRRWTPPPADA
jgi:hypothetical protein